MRLPGMTRYIAWWTCFGGTFSPFHLSTSKHLSTAVVKRLDQDSQRIATVDIPAEEKKGLDKNIAFMLSITIERSLAIHFYPWATLVENENQGSVAAMLCWFKISKQGDVMPRNLVCYFVSYGIQGLIPVGRRIQNPHPSRVRKHTSTIIDNHQGIPYRSLRANLHDNIAHYHSETAPNPARPFLGHPYQPSKPTLRGYISHKQ